MHRYTQSLEALTTALNLMIEEGDSHIVAAIAHPLHLIETRILRERMTIVPTQPGPAPRA